MQVKQEKALAMCFSDWDQFLQNDSPLKGTALSHLPAELLCAPFTGGNYGYALLEAFIHCIPRVKKLNTQIIH